MRCTARLAISNTDRASSANKGAANIGGLVCKVHRNAALRFDAVPTEPSDKIVFDKQMRELFTLDSIATGVVDAGHAEEVCTILAKEHFSQADRHTLFDLVEATYEED